MSWSKLSFNIPIHYGQRPPFLSLNRLREAVDDYFAWGDEVAYVPAFSTNFVELRRNNLPHNCQYWVKCAFKVASYFTLILPVVMCLAKIMLRASPFYLLPSHVTHIDSSSTPRILTLQQVEKMSCEQISEISSIEQTYGTFYSTPSGVTTASLTLAPTVLESALATIGVYEEIMEKIIAKSRHINRDIPTTILEEVNDDEKTTIQGTIKPLELAFLAGSGQYLLMIKNGAKLSAKPLSVLHPAITGFRLSHLLRSALQNQLVQEFVLDCFKKCKIDLAMMDSDSPERTWEGRTFEHTCLIAALIGFRKLTQQSPQIFEIFKQLWILGADFHQNSIRDEHPVLISSLWTRKFENHAHSSLFLDYQRLKVSAALSWQRANNKEIQSETLRKIEQDIEELEIELAKQKSVIEEAPFQAFINFHQAIFYSLDKSLDDKFPSNLLDLIGEYITDINNTLLTNYKNLFHPEKLVNHFICDLIPCLIIREYLDNVDYSRVINTAYRVDRFMPYSDELLRTYVPASHYSRPVSPWPLS